ncbi:hypothetical protein F4778DRAFT_778365 [Xylariomycetidae sp. FL2044]|nr:hypothetical protein F4778DRAFT_778365 [Xylariomycetidae sp. FL2044]
MLSSHLLRLAGLASLVAVALGSAVAVRQSPAQYCCNCLDCSGCDASCPDPGCTIWTCCCAAERVFEERDGTIRAFNAFGKEMTFISRPDQGPA